MRLLFDELLDIFSRYSSVRYEDDWDYRNENVLDELTAAIIKLAAPKTVGDVMILPEDLRTDGFICLIDRDASGHYDQVEGYVDAVIWKDIQDRITPSEHGFDGWELCEWIDRQYPVQAEEEEVPMPCPS